ncbi:LipA and NB-ARC domain-containing protein [Colletotrichum karsti]|uniref:LipA and NB-ARC domain-containing protein n=1 Tax=Colletotrichum karsti TaxID=1095194 RepID=A0A9P6LHH6_9PEZI|nr:LipA and NB-ARC domain-containing protein [Colletotrichum karsti]KAF9873583.1 LipA and NB-ARC domain-containing protein [Colletotrichum karsti]
MLNKVTPALFLLALVAHITPIHSLCLPHFPNNTNSTNTTYHATKPKPSTSPLPLTPIKQDVYDPSEPYAAPWPAPSTTTRPPPGPTPTYTYNERDRTWAELCGPSSYVSNTKYTSALAADCQLLADKARDMGFNIRTLKPKFTDNHTLLPLHTEGTCSFGIRPHTMEELRSATTGFFIGNWDIADIVDKVVRNFTVDGLAGGSGLTRCRYIDKSVNVHWTVYGPGELIDAGWEPAPPVPSSAEKGSINKQVTRYGISAVFTHPGAKVDVVLVHGLNGDPEQTWTARNGVFWPADLLPQSLKDVNANILVYGYNADVYSTKSDRSPSSNFIYQHARNLVTDLTFYRKSVGTSANPIIWLAHSLGGLLLKSALLYSNDVKDQNLGDARSVYISTYAIVFLGTPHTGSDMATWGHMLQRMADAVMPRKFLESESVLVKTLKKDNEILQGINSHFLDIYQRLQIHMVHESHKTDIKGTKVMIVDAGSAGPQLPGVTYYGIEATHSGMCKFDDTNAPGYRNVSTAIREWAMEAPVVIQTRWEVEQEQRRSQAHNEAVERTREYGSQVGQYAPLVVSPVGTGSPTLFSPSQAGSQHELPSPREPPFFVPDKFRPNSYFKGREDELQDLHRMLMDKKRRSEGTSAVVIQGIPGAGKTHLARQYVFNYKQHYPGGIYWIRSTSPQDMETEIWRIAKTQAIREMIGQEEKNDLSNPQKMVEIVRKWFNDFSGWLLVLDGIRSDNRLVSEFIPDSKDSSLILTSTERNLAGNHLLDNPRVMELGLLPAQDARELLLEEMGKKPPHSMDDLRRALDLVQLMDRLPLMIHAAAQHMNETREPLAKYLKSYRDKPRVGMLPAYKTIRDQLQNRGDTSALNLMYILCFFSQLVPVEMLALGLKALDKRTPIGRDANGRRQSLNGVFVTLIKFALIERNQMDDIPSTSSQSSHQTIDTSSEPLDVLQIHSVVQAFFIELLGEEKQLEFWLERAVRIFCFSFEEADSRMKKDPTTGLPDDYRRYTIHGKKLLEHLDRHYKSKNADLARVRADLEAILPRLPEEIDSLQRTISTSIVDGKEPVEHLSIFERSNSMSSTSTDTSNGASYPNVGHGTEDKTFESPTTYEIPSRFHVPYPNMLDDQGSRDEDDRTITPYPPDTVLGPYDGTGDEKSDESEWIQVLPRHRSFYQRSPYQHQPGVGSRAHVHPRSTYEKRRPLTKPAQNVCQK